MLCITDTQWLYTILFFIFVFIWSVWQIWELGQSAMLLLPQYFEKHWYKSFCMHFVIFINEHYNLSTGVSPKSPLSTHTPGWQITAPLGLPCRSVLIAPNGIRPQRAWLQYRPAGTQLSLHTRTYILNKVLMKVGKIMLMQSCSFECYKYEAVLNTPKFSVVLFHHKHTTWDRKCACLRVFTEWGLPHPIPPSNSIIFHLACSSLSCWGSWGFGALLKGLTSVVDNSCQSWDSNPQPRVTSPTLYPLGCSWNCGSWPNHSDSVIEACDVPVLDHVVSSPLPLKNISLTLSVHPSCLVLFLHGWKYLILAS